MSSYIYPCIRLYAVVAGRPQVRCRLISMHFGFSGHGQGRRTVKLITQDFLFIRCDNVILIALHAPTSCKQTYFLFDNVPKVIFFVQLT